eukprot:4725203-Heterocapsa_arctica.AAC.1
MRKVCPFIRVDALQCICPIMIAGTTLCRSQTVSSLAIVAYIPSVICVSMNSLLVSSDLTMSLCDPLCIFSGRAFLSMSPFIIAEGGPVTWVQWTKSWTEMATVIHAAHHRHE